MSNRRIKLMISIVDLAAGTGVFARNLGAGLKRYFPGEFEIILLTFRDEPNVDPQSFDQAQSLHLQVRPGVRQVMELPHALRRMRRAIREIQPDLILSVHTFANWLSSRCAGEVPVILTDHLNLTMRHRMRGKTPFAKSFLRRMYRKRLVIGVSQDVTTDLQQNYGAVRAATIHNGIDLDQVPPAGDGKSDHPNPGPYVVAVGRLFAQKDYATLIRAFGMARERSLPLRLVIVGEGPLRSRLQTLIDSLYLRDVVHMVGHQANPFPFIRGARMLAMSSLYEGFGMVLPEALALGVPCVSTDCLSGPVEVLNGGENGLLVPTMNPLELANAMLRLDSDESLRQQFIAKAPQRAADFGIEPMTRRYREILIAELKTKPRAR